MINITPQEIDRRFKAMDARIAALESKWSGTGAPEGDPDSDDPPYLGGALAAPSATFGANVSEPPAMPAPLDIVEDRTEAQRAADGDSEEFVEDDDDDDDDEAEPKPAAKPKKRASKKR